MKAYQLAAFGPENLQLSDMSPGDLAGQQVRVRMRAASINYRDFMIASGFYNPNLELPMVPLSDGAGEIIEVGADVSGLSVGDRVTSLFWPTWRGGLATWQTRSASTGCELPGVLAEEIVVDSSHVMPFPDYLSYQEASTLPCAALTAWVGLTSKCDTKPGESVLIQGSGGVSVCALQMAKALGATVVATSSSEEKLAKLKALGADQVINYKDTPEWGAAVMESTGGVDNIIEIGGAGTLSQSLDAAGLNGSIAMIGTLTGLDNQLSLMPVLGKNLNIHGVTVGSCEEHAGMLAFLEKHQIKPVISEVLPFEKAGEALASIAAGSHFGKIVVDIG